MTSQVDVSTEPKQLPLREFIVLMAMTFAMVAFSVDAMLPALPEIGAAISPDDLNKAQIVLTSFIFGMGIGTFFTGPLSDTFGRKRVIFWGTVLFVIGAAIAAASQSLEMMILGRVVQGLGVAGPRIVSLAIVRDLYRGRQMASILSYAMMIFTLVPAIAPALGAEIIDLFGWRAIFLSFIVFAVIVIGWMMIRQPETLPVERRKPFRVRTLVKATGECFSHRIFSFSVLSQIVSFAMLFGMLSSTQQIFTETYGKYDTFPLWFGVIAIIAGTASIVNAKLVYRFGMRAMAGVGYFLVALLSFIMLVWMFSTLPPFWMFMAWTTSVFFMAGLVIGNLNALAMEPIGHIAGLGASIMGAVATVGGVLIAAPVGLAFDGTPLPLAIALLVLALIGMVILRFGLRSDK